MNVWIVLFFLKTLIQLAQFHAISYFVVQFVAPLFWFMVSAVTSCQFFQKKKKDVTTPKHMSIRNVVDPSKAR